MLRAGYSVRMCTQDALNRIGQRSCRIAATTAACRQQDQARMATTVCQALGCDRTEVLDVIGHNRTLLARRRVDDLAIRSLDQIGALSRGHDIQAAFS